MDVKTWANVCAYLAMAGINSRRFAMILYAMVAEVATYREAMEAYAEWIGDAPERVHAANCGELLRVGIEQQPGEFLETAARGGKLLAD